MCFGAPRRRLHQRGATHQPCLQRLDDRACEVVLEHEDVLQLPVIRVRPEMIPVRSVDQLSRDPDLSAFATDAPFEDRGDVQLLCDVADIDVLSPVDVAGSWTTSELSRSL